MSPKPKWFDVDLDTLRLSATKRTDWAVGMDRPQARMKEECLESVVAFNLDLLFPGEDLLLVNTQSKLMAVADIVAIDPLGILRVMELKTKPAKRDDLEKQVISYAVGTDGPFNWLDAMAKDITFFPEAVAMAIEGFASNEQAKTVGEGAVEEAFPEIRWKDYDRFGQAKLKADTLRAERNKPVGPPALYDDRVQQICRRIYSLDISEIAHGVDPPTVVSHIIAARWGSVPRVSTTEFALVAPGIGEAKDEAERLERVVNFTRIRP